MAGPAVCQVSGDASQAINLLAAELKERSQPQEQVFEVSRKVLVAGSGLSAMWSAQSLAQAGYEVVLFTPVPRLTQPDTLYGEMARERSETLKQQVSQNPAIQIIKGGELISFSGSTGHFQATILDLQGERINLTVGAALLAQAPPQALNYDGAEAGNLMSLEELLGLLSAPEHFKKRFNKDSIQVGIGLGLTRQSSPAFLNAACRAAKELIEKHQARVSIYTDYAKVAQPELERFSQIIREIGAVLVKFTGDMPKFKAAEDGIEAGFVDEIAECPIKQKLDILAVDTISQPDQAWLGLVGRLGLTPDPVGYAYDPRPGMMADEAKGRGIYVLAPASGPVSLEQLGDQIGHVQRALGNVLGAGGQKSLTSRIKVDRKKCAICLTCVRVCPTGAMEKHDRRPQSNPLACTACGTCASECPMDAIQVLDYEDERMDKVVQAGLSTPGFWEAPEFKPEVLVLACANSAVRSLQKARSMERELPPGIRLVQVPCAGKIDPQMVMRAFQQGYDLVQVIACHADACYSLDGNTWAGLREDNLRRMLEEAGMETSRLKWDSASPNMNHQAMDLVYNARNIAVKLGASPLKSAAKARDLLSKFTLKMDDTYTIVP
jgi:coenzyme F420-reducing hydrogenase delta subunit/Pyruvate/2-oxoacid:ferredoxin oxidoreductase delta subunit